MNKNSGELALKRDLSFSDNKKVAKSYEPKILKYVTEHPGCSMSDLYHDLELDDIPMYIALHNLVTEKKLEGESPYLVEYGSHDRYKYTVKTEKKASIKISWDEYNRSIYAAVKVHEPGMKDRPHEYHDKEEMEILKKFVEDNEDKIKAIVSKVIPTDAVIKDIHLSSLRLHEMSGNKIYPMVNFHSKSNITSNFVAKIAEIKGSIAAIGKDLYELIFAYPIPKDLFKKEDKSSVKSAKEDLIEIDDNGFKWEVEIMDSTHLKMRMKGTERFGIPLHFRQVDDNVIKQLKEKGLVQNNFFVEKKNQ